MNYNSSGCSSDLSPLSEGVLLLASNRPKKRAGRKKFKETRHPVYRGVRRRNNNRWVCEVREPSEQKRIWLGTYPTPEMAARAHDVAALALRGNLAILNFADSRWRLPVPVSNDPKDIRQAAVEAAEAFREDPELAGVDCRNDEEGKYQEIDIASSSDFGAEKLNMCMENMDGWRERRNEGVLYSPTPGLGSCFSWDDVESEVEVSLWSYNF